MKPDIKMTDEKLDALLGEAFESLRAPDELVDRARDAVASQPAQRKIEVVHVSTPHRHHVRRTPRHFRAAAALAACLVLGLFGFGGYAAWADVSVVVAVDVNPSIEMSLNRFDRVVSARGVNDDGVQLLDRVDVVGKRYEDALAALMSDCGSETDGSSSDAEIAVTIVSMGSGDTSSYADRAVSAAETAGVACVCDSASEDEYDTASSHGLPVAKYRMFVHLKELGIDIDEQQVAEMSMKELRSLAGIEQGGLSSGQHQGDGKGDGRCNGSDGNGDGSGYGNCNGKGGGKAEHASSAS